MDIETAVYTQAEDGDITSLIHQGKLAIKPSDSPSIAYTMFIQRVQRSIKSPRGPETIYQFFDFTGNYFGSVKSDNLLQALEGINNIIKEETQNGRGFSEIYLKLESYLANKDFLNGQQEV